MTGRSAELAAGLAETRERIADACAQAGRDPAGVTLVAVSKTWPVEDLATVLGLGQRDLGENRAQELADKAAALTAPRWHFVGQLQSNKARRVARLAHVVHTVDRTSLLPGLAAGAADAGRVLDCLLQVSLDGDPHRGGVLPGALAALAADVAVRPELRLAGVMAVAPLGADPDRAFAELRTCSDLLVSEHPGATEISAGMSGDLVEAIRHGATLVRVGTALFGRRGPFVG